MGGDVSHGVTEQFFAVFRLVMKLAVEPVKSGMGGFVYDGVDVEAFGNEEDVAQVPALFEEAPAYSVVTDGRGWDSGFSTVGIHCLRCGE